MSVPVRLDPFQMIRNVGWGGQYWFHTAMYCDYRPVLASDNVVYNFHNAEAFVLQQTASGTNFYEGGDLLVENTVKVTPWSEGFVSLAYSSLVNLSLAAAHFPDLDTIDASIFIPAPYAFEGDTIWTAVNGAAYVYNCARDNFAIDPFSNLFYAIDYSAGQVASNQFLIEAGVAGSRSHKYVYDKLQPNPSLSLSVVVL